MVPVFGGHPVFLSRSSFPFLFPVFLSRGPDDDARPTSTARRKRRVIGSLRIKDIELPLDMEIAFGGAGLDSDGRHRVGFEGRAALRRSDWGLDWNAPPATGGVLISDRVTLTLGISAVRQERAAAAA
ncbi:YceI family protein [Streptomyces sp. NPDC060275]|uniref:YceI family protein n=1 Tax=Streptomyces sp. NPDC060275 TaxID=3347090 RepID=UPI003666DB44